MKTEIMLCTIALLLVAFTGSAYGQLFWGESNTFYGLGAGLNALDDNDNSTLIGAYAGYMGSTGIDNTFVGYHAGYNNNSNWNTFVGSAAGFSNTSGGSNTFIGQNAGYSNAIAWQNTFMGTNAGYSNTEGYDNIFIGWGAGYWNTLGFENIFIGVDTGSQNTTGNWNTFLGARAGHSNTGGGSNTFIGQNAGYSNTTAWENTFIGTNAGYSTTEGHDNIFIGWGAGYFNKKGVENTCIGARAGHHNDTGSWNTSLGVDAGFSNSTGEGNTFLGHGAGYSNNGVNNTFVGDWAGRYNYTGSGNVFLGRSAGYDEAGSDKLYISNTDTNPPLIYGEFDNNILSINGRLGVLKSPGASYQLDVNGAVNATSFTGNGSGLTNLTELDPKVGTLTAGKWCSSSDGSQVTCTQNAPLLAETDPKVGTLSTGQWCTSNGSVVNCTQAPPVTVDKVGSLNSGQWCSSDGSKIHCTQAGPVTTEVDPKVGSLGTDRVPRWNGSQLVTGIIADTGSVATVHGAFGVGVSPLYLGDFSGGGVSESQLHFSLNGTDTGGWITSVSDNNFWLSSGAMYSQSEGGWIQKSPDGKAVMAGSGVNGYRVVTASGNTVGQPLKGLVVRLQIDYSGNVGLGIAPAHPFHLAGGAYSDGGSWINGSSREYKENIRELSTEEALKAFGGLNPVAFSYKAGKGEQHVGFIAEDVPELVATKDRKGLSPMDIVAVLTKVVQELKAKNEKLEERLMKLEGKVK